MDNDVRRFLEERSVVYPRTLAYYLELWSGHFAAGLANKHFVTELTSGNDAKFAQRVWEMLLARHLMACGHAINSRPEGEPDFRFEYAGQVVWVEAVSPEPGPDLSCALPVTGTIVQHRETLLRWTTAFSSKSNKGLEYRRKNVVKPADAYVIAIDGSQLGWSPLTHGASQRMPYIVEATFAVGPFALRIDSESGRFLGTTTTISPATRNRNDSLVPTEVFFDPGYSHVSAAIGCVPPALSRPELPVQVAYNPLAGAPLKSGLFGGSAEEWGAKLVAHDGEWQEWDPVHHNAPAD